MIRDTWIILFYVKFTALFSSAVVPKKVESKAAKGKKGHYKMPTDCIEKSKNIFFCPTKWMDRICRDRNGLNFVDTGSGCDWRYKFRERMAKSIYERKF